GALHFRVGGLVAGAEVSLYSGDQLIGRTTAQSDSAIVETDPSFSWTDGVHSITAVQILRDQEVKIGNLDETVDLISPAASPIELTVLSVDEGALLEHQAGSTAGPGPADFTLAPGAPAGASLDATTGQLTWQTTEPDGPGLYAIVIEVTQAGGGTKEPLLVKVREVNVPPAINPIADRTGDQAVDEHVALLLDVIATDDDLPANTLTFDLGPGAPQGASIDPTTGRFAWTASESQGGQQFAVTVRVWDEYGAMGEETFNVDVSEVNDPPAFDPINMQTVAPGEQLRVTVGAHDTDDPANAKPLLYSLDAGPEGASIHPTSGEITWDVPEDFFRDHDPADPVELTVRVTEDVGPGQDGLSVVETLKVMVEDPRPALAFALTEMQARADRAAGAPLVPSPELPAALAPAFFAPTLSPPVQNGGVFDSPATSLDPGLGGSDQPVENENTEEKDSSDLKDNDADGAPNADDQTDGDQGAALDANAPSDQDPAGLSDAAIELLAAQEGPDTAAESEPESPPESPPEEPSTDDADSPQPSATPAPEQVAAS
ncbi:MAG: putative Ig domain-containing protein, partial [Planctomycetota bacterium]